MYLTDALAVQRPRAYRSLTSFCDERRELCRVGHDDPRDCHDFSRDGSVMSCREGWEVDHRCHLPTIGIAGFRTSEPNFFAFTELYE